MISKGEEDTSNAGSYITQKLKEKYQGNSYLSRFLSDEQYPLTDSYINLVIVKQEEAKEREKELDKKEDKNCLAWLNVKTLVYMYIDV